MEYLVPDVHRSYVQSSGVIPSGSTIAREIARMVAAYPERIAVMDDYGTLTYRELWDASSAGVEWLRSLGARPGGRVAALVPNRREYIFMTLAIYRLGAALVPLPVSYRAEEIATILEHAVPDVIVVVREFLRTDFLGMVTATIDHLRLPTQILLLDDHQDWKGSDPTSIPDPEPDEVAAIMYTSGTTGVPKGVMHSHEGLLRMARSSNVVRRNGDADVWLVLVPLTHALGLEYGMPCALITGNTMILTDVFEAERAVRTVIEQRVSCVLAVPTMVIRMLNALSPEDDVSRVRNIYLGGMAAPPESMRAIMDRFDCSISMTYGATEFGHATMTELEDDLDTICSTSGGPIHGGVEIRIMDGDRTAPMGEVGEVWIRGPMLFQGYFHDEARTAAARRQGGWVSVQDLGYLSPEGRLTIVGRIKDLIVRGGQNIYPNEIEAILQRHDDILEASVVPVADAELGERTCACVITKRQGTELTRNDILPLFEGVARYKIPDYVLTFAEFPLTSAGKVRKPLLSQEVQGRLKPASA